MQKVYLYYAKASDGECNRELHPKERMKEIQACNNESVRREKYRVWELLEYAVKDALALDFNNQQFTKLPSGQWICDAFSFSLSHSDGVVAVALSDSAVGVDIEAVRAIDDRLSHKVLADSELARYSQLSYIEKGEFLLYHWCKKEAIFKASGESVLLPKSIECDKHRTLLERINIDGREYVIAVAAKDSFTIDKISI